MLGAVVREREREEQPRRACAVRTVRYCGNVERTSGRRSGGTTERGPRRGSDGRNIRWFVAGRRSSQSSRIDSADEGSLEKKDLECNVHVQCAAGAVIPVPGELSRGECQLAATPTTCTSNSRTVPPARGPRNFGRTSSLSAPVPSPSGLQAIGGPRTLRLRLRPPSSTPSSPSTNPDLECSSSRSRAIPHFLRKSSPPAHLHTHIPTRHVDV